MISIKNEDFLNKLGLRIREVRTTKGYTQEQLADIAGIRESQIGRIERGEINTSVSTARIIAKALQVELKELFDFDWK